MDYYRLRQPGKGAGTETSTKAYRPSVMPVTVMMPEASVASDPMIWPSFRILKTAPSMGLSESSDLQQFDLDLGIIF